MPMVNDVHSALNQTRVSKVQKPKSLTSLKNFLSQAVAKGESLSICGGRHAMGGQAFAENTLLLDLTCLNRVLYQDCARGLITMQAGATWPAVLAATMAMPHPSSTATAPRCWAIRQKQTGVDSVTLGGSVSANAHGRGLLLAPMAEDVEALHMLNAQGELLFCNREENAELFGLAIGGYGLFGIIYAVTLRLCLRTVVQRWVDVLDLDDAANAVYRRVQQGFSYGDFQFAIDANDSAFLSRGVFSCYREVDSQDFETFQAAQSGLDQSKAQAAQSALDKNTSASDFKPEQWLQLLHLAHTDKARAFTLYAENYLRTHGNRYWADSMQLATYLPSYAEYLHQNLPKSTTTRSDVPETLMIGELYVPPAQLQNFMQQARAIFRAFGTEVIYGTIRAIEADQTSFLKWAKRAYCCVVFNLRTAHHAQGVAHSAATFSALIDAALALEGSFYLTYHRWWTRAQLLKAYPQIPEFLARKLHFDPKKTFVSDWYRHLVNAS
jgi:FAD/FMN-containing dehydrogenase